jgi:hypothetical protein
MASGVEWVIVFSCLTTANPTCIRLDNKQWPPLFECLGFFKTEEECTEKAKSLVEIYLDEDHILVEYYCLPAPSKYNPRRHQTSTAAWFGYSPDGSAPGEETRMRHKPAHAPARAKPIQSASHATMRPDNPAPTSAPPTYGTNGTCSPLPMRSSRRLAEGGLPWCGGKSGEPKLTDLGRNI